MDEILALLEENPLQGDGEEEDDEGEEPSNSRGHDDDDSDPNNKHHRQQQNQLSLSVDVKVDIRMINRRIAGADLLDLVCGYENNSNYHSPASLAASSLAALNRTLVEPASVINRESVCGKTQLTTVGIVFSNTGTRVAASSGNAYCLLVIGTLSAGPCVSVLLFGSAYSRHCRQCKPGNVVALVQPRLVPSKQDGNASASQTAVTFSVSEARQLLLVGDARDYAICKATVRGMLSNGQWVADAKRCKNYVDTRICEYCQTHRKLANTKNVGIGTSSAIQQLQLESRAFPTAQGRNLNLLGNHNQHRQLTLPGGGRPTLLTATAAPAAAGKSRSEEMMAQFQMRAGTNLSMAPPQTNNINNKKLPPNNHTLAQNRILNPPISSLSSQPASNLHQTINRYITSRNASSNNRILNPVAKQQLHTSTSSLSKKATTMVTTNPYLASSSALRKQAAAATTTQQAPIPKNAPLRLNSLLNPTQQQAGRQQQQQQQQQPPSASVRSSSASSSQPSGASNKDWLKELTQKRHRSADPLTNTTKSKLAAGLRGSSLNTDTCGFDGSVVVPKPSRMFGGAGAGATGGPAVMPQQSLSSSTCARRVARQPASLNEERIKDDILFRQREMAEKMNEQTTANKSKRYLVRTTGRKQSAEIFGRCSSTKNAKEDQRQQQKGRNKRASFFDAIDDIDTSQVLEAKSKFANEVEAEDYARSRNRVVALEKEEHVKASRAANKQSKQKDEETLIQKEWFCHNCKRAHKTNPVMCQRSGHNVKIRRKIKETTTTGEKRLALSEKNAEDGGLKLGSGIDWTRQWSRFSS